MKVVTLMNFKGGVAKSTLATHLAAGSAIRGKRVLMIDTDPQAHATLMMNYPPVAAFHDLLVRDAAFRDVIRPVDPAHYSIDGQAPRGQLMLIGSNEETRVIPLQISDPILLRDRLEELSSTFDLVVIDTPPTPSLLQTVIYLATDAILYPTKCAALSFDGLAKSLEHRQRVYKLRVGNGMPQVAILGIVPTLFRGNTMEHTEMLASLQAEFGDLVWPPVPERIIWEEASRLHRPVFSLAPESRAAQDAWALVDQMDARMLKIGA